MLTPQVIEEGVCLNCATNLSTSKHIKANPPATEIETLLEAA